MHDRPPELHVSALSPTEFRAYTRYLDLLALAQAREGDGGLDADGSVRFDRDIVRDFAVERLDVPRAVVNDVLELVPGDGRLAANQVYAVLRLLAHVAPVNPRSPRSPRTPRPPPKALDVDLVFVPVDPLPLDPEILPLAPPRRAVSATGSTGGPSRVSPLPAPKPTLPPRRLTPPPAPPSPPSRRATVRKSLPAGHSLDPFRDSPSPTTSPAKTRTYSTSSVIGAVGSNNPFRLGAAAAAPTPLMPLDNPPPSSTHKVGPPLPPRKPSIRRPGPALPPRQNSYGAKTDTRAESLSSSSASASAWSDGPTRQQPTSTTTPSDIMQQSLAAAAANEGVRSRREDSVLEVIRSSSLAVHGNPASGATAPPPPGRRDIIETVTRAVRESEVDCLPPPQRVPSGTRPKTMPSTSPSSSGAFNMSADQYRQKHPGLKTWSTVGLLSDKPLRSSFALIILNVSIPRKDALLRAWASSTLRFCADGGANRLYDALDPDERASMLPTMIKGDLDSLRPDVRAYYTARGVAIKRDPSEYSTDLMKCMEEVEGIESASGKHFSLLFFGGLSGRLDQTVHTMSILFKLRSTRRDTFVISDDSLAWVLDTGVHLIEVDHATMGQTCGILPVGVNEAFVRTEGLKWNLDWVTSLGGELSTSNHLLPSEPAVLLETTAPVFWTVEISSPLSLPNIRSSVSHADEISRGVKELGVGFVRAAGNVGRRLSRQGVPQSLSSTTANGDRAVSDGYWEQHREHREQRAQVGDREWSRERERRERVALVGTDHDSDYGNGHGHGGRDTEPDGYALLD